MSGTKPAVGIRVAIDGADKAKRDLEAIKAAGSDAFGKVQTAAGAAVPEMQRFGGALSGLSSVAGAAGLSFAALGAAAVASTTAIAKAGDTAIATMARLSTAAGSLGGAQTAYESLFRLSQQTGVSVADSAASFSRFAVAAREIGGTNAQVLALVGGIQKAGIVAGASAQETSAAVQQIGQALAAGTLQGDELRSLMENMPQLAARLARELGVSLGQLKAMGSEGQLQADRVFPALLKAAEGMASEFEKMPPTMSRAFDILGAAMTNFTSQLDNALGLSQGIAQAAMAAAAAVNSVQRRVAPTAAQAAENAVTAAQGRLTGVQAQIAAERGASAYGDVSPAFREAERIAEEELRDALSRRAQIQRDAREDARADAEAAATQARVATRTRAQTELDDLVLKNDKQAKAQQEYWDKTAKINAAEAAGVTKLKNGDAFVANDQRIKAAQEYLDVLAKVEPQSARAVAAVKPKGEPRDYFEEAAQKAIEEQNRRLTREQEQATRELVSYQERSYNELANSVERAFDRVGDAIVNAFVGGQGAAVNWGNLARGIIGSIASDLAKLAIVNPIINSLTGATGSGARPTLGGAGLGDISSLLGLGNLSETLGLSGIGKSLGLTGGTGLLSQSLGTSLLGSTSLTVGSAFGGIGLGFGAGQLVNGLLGGNSTGGMLGSGLGAAAGFALGGPVGALLGGALGGGAGGLFGPGQANQGWSYNLVGRGALGLESIYASQAGAAQLQQAQQAVEQINAYLASAGLTASGMRAVGGTRFGAGGLGYGEASSFGEAFSALRFGAANDNTLNSALASQSFGDPATLQAFVQDYQNTKALIAQVLAANESPAQQLEKALNGVLQQFDALSRAAQRYGLSEAGLAEARDKSLQALYEQAAAQEKATKAQEDATAAQAAAEAKREALTGRGILANLTLGSASALPAEQRYFAAVSLLNSARQDLEAGGSLSEYGSVVSQALPVARDYLGTSTRYAALAAEVANVVTSNGGGGGSLAAMLNAQVQGTDTLTSLTAAIGDRTVGELTALRQEVTRLNLAIEAIIARKVA